MHVHSITLANVRQFESATYEFQPGFNLLVGENGAGKTTLLRALLAVLGDAKQSGRRPALADDDIRLGTHGLWIEAEIAEERGTLKGVARYEKELATRARRTGKHMDLLVLLYGSNEATCASFVGHRTKRYTATNKHDMRLIEESVFDIEMGVDRYIAPKLRFGRSRAIRSFVLKMLSSFSSDFTDFVWSFEPYDCSIHPSLKNAIRPENFALLRRTLANAIMRYFQESNEPRGWPAQQRVILDSNGFYLGPDNERRQRTPSLRELLGTNEPDKRTIDYLESCTIEIRLTPRIVIRNQRGNLLLHQLSDGQQRLFSIVADIARQLSLRTQSGRINEIEAIVLIDEIDVHLHPMWQRRIVPALEDLFPACQFIATTHSPFIVQATQEGQVQQLDGSAIGDVADRGIEEIAAKVMQVETQTGRRYIQMLEAAKDYLRALESTSRSSRREINRLRSKLNKLSAGYARNPAYQAFLELKTDARLGSEDGP